MQTHVAVITVSREGRTEVRSIACPGSPPRDSLGDAAATVVRRLRARLRTSTHLIGRRAT